MIRRVCGAALALAGLLACAPPTEIDVQVDAPREVPEGTRFEISARVRNLAAEPQVLRDIDVADSYLEGIAIESTVPRFYELMHVPIDNSMSYTFDLSLEPGEEVSVTFHAIAKRPGLHHGTIDVCINHVASCLFLPVSTRVL